MRNDNRTAKVNVKVLIILLLVVVALGVSLVAARQIRRKILSKMDLDAGTAAFEEQNWPLAARHLQEYLGRNPDDVEILKKYAKARLSIRPLEAASIGGAISAYRRVMQLNPTEDIAYEKLAVLYPATANFPDLAYIARRRLELVPDDKKAPVWLAEALIQLNKAEEAQQTLEGFIAGLEAAGEADEQYVRACGLMSQIASDSGSPDASSTALGWLDKAVEYAPKSVEALAQRAAFRRQMAANAAGGEVDAGALLTLAVDDLTAADAIETDNPKSLYFLAREWLLHGQLDRAEAKLQAAKELPEEALSEHFFDLADWTVARFSLESQLAVQRGDTARAAALADAALAELTEKRHRLQVLPSAIPLYVAVGDAAKARQYLTEYIDVEYTRSGTAESKLRTAYLRALVARAEDNAYGVIDVLSPVVVTDASRPDLWRLLAEAFSRTDQPRRAVNALIRYLRLRPRDPQMTLELAKEYLKLRDWNRAFETARLAEPLDPTDIALRLLRIEAGIYIAAEQQQDLDTARLNALAEELTELRRNHPNRIDIRILQAMIAVYRNEPEVAVEELKRAIAECEEPLRAEMQLVRQYYRTKRMAEAIGLCREACRRHPEVAEPWLSLSGLYVSDNDNDAARRCLRDGLEAVVGKWEKRSLSLRLALLELMDGDRAAGIGLLTDLVTSDAREVHARTVLLGTREVREDPARAQALIDELRVAEGESGLMWRLHQASLWLGSDDWRSKQQDITSLLQYGIDADPEWSAPVLALAQMYEKLNDPARVEEVCRQALSRNPSATDIADKLMGLLENQRRFADAKQVLQQVETDARVSSAWQIQMALRAGDFSSAIDELRLRVSNDDRDAESRILLARLLYWQMKDAEQAHRYLAEAEEIAPDSMALMAAKASILRAEGRGEEAQRTLNEYVGNKDDFGAYMLRAAYFTSQGELEKAENDYRKLTTFPDNDVAGYMLLSDFYRAHDKLDQAITTLDEGLDKHADEARLQRALMRALFQRMQGPDEQKALGLLGVLEGRMPRDPELMMLRAMHLLRTPTRESLAAAKEKLEGVVRLEPTAVDAHLVLIDILLREGANTDARDAALRALGANPENPTLLAARGRAELALQNTQMATQLANLALGIDPNNAQARDLIATAALRTADRALLQQALGLQEKALAGGPANGPLLLRRAQVLVALKEPQKAIPELEVYCGTQNGRRDVTALVMLVDLYRITGNTEKAGQTIDRAYAVDPNSQPVMHARLLCLVAEKRYDELEGMGSAYLATQAQDAAMILNAGFALLSCDSPGPKKEAVPLFERVTELSPGTIDARVGLASSLYHAGQTERAEAIRQEIWNQCRHDAGVCVAVASRMYQTGYAEGAEKTYRAVLQENPNDVRSLNDLAWVLQEHYQRYDEALALADRGLAVAPDDLHLLDTQATILSNLPDRLADAKRAFERQVELSPANTQRQAQALLKLGRLCAKLGDLAEARQHVKKALAIDESINVFTAAERSEIAGILE
jgi:predicted Zn-dependent protease